MPDFKEVIVVPSGVGLWPSARDLRSGPATGRAVLLSGPDSRLLGTWRWSGRGRRCRRRCRRTNWSPALDAMILWKTLFAVVRGKGAY
jgi:hypothetical protein